MVLSFVNVTSPGMLLAATTLITLPRLSQDLISAPIVQVGATGAAGHHAELSLAGRGWYQEKCALKRFLGQIPAWRDLAARCPLGPPEPVGCCQRL